MIEPIYTSADLFVESKQTLPEKIAAVEAIIDALMALALKAAAKGNIQSYYLNDGQTQIRTDYRTVVDIERSINAFQRILNMYRNMGNGRMVRLVPGSNFTGRRW